MRIGERFTRGRVGGFSLIEVMMALSISTVVGAALYFLYNHQIMRSISEKNVTELQESSRFMMEAMGRDLIMAGYRPAEAPGISEASPNRITFEYWDDKAINLPPYDKHFRVSFRVNTGDIHKPLIREIQRYNPAAAVGSRWSTAQSSILGEYVKGLEFTYFDDQNQVINPGTTPALLEEVRRIRVVLTNRSYDRDPFLKDYKTTTSSRTFQARNLGITGNPQDITKPLPPQNVQVIDPGVCGELRVKWSANTEADLEGYHLYLGQETGEYTKKFRIASNLTTYTLTGLTSTKTTDGTPVIYFVAMSAYDKSANNSDLSTEISGNPLVSVDDFNDVAIQGNDTTINPLKPLRPDNFEARNGPTEGSVALTWTLSSSPGVVAYRLFRGGAPGFVATGSTPGDGNCIAVLPADAVAHIDSDLLGCVTYYYKICALNCDDSLVTIYDQALDYGETYGDGPAMDIADDFPTVNVSDSTPTDTTPIDGDPYPVPLLSSQAGWQRVFVNLTNPNLSDDPDFSHTLVYFNKGGGYPRLTPGTCDLEPGTGDLLPDSGGRFTQVGSGGTNAFVFDSEDEETPDSPSLQPPTATFFFLAVSFDRCGNCSSTTDQATTLSILCGDDPPGLPQCEPSFTMLADAELGCNGSNVYLNWTGDCLKDGVIGLNHDFAGFEVFRNEGAAYDPDAASHVNLSSNVPQWSQGFTDALASEGTFYSYAIKWVDCAWANNNGGNISNPEVNGGLIQGVSLGQLVRDGNLVLTGDLTLTPPTYFHNKVKFAIRNTSAGPLVINNLSLSWSNPLAYLAQVMVGDDASTTRQLIWGGAPPTPIVTTLSAAISDVDDVIGVTSTQSLFSPGLVKVDDELIAYRHKSPLLGQITEAYRGVSGTVAAAHAAGSETRLVGFANFLAADLSAAASIINVESAADFNTTNPLRIENEQVTCSGKTDTSLTGCTRGAAGSTAEAHSMGTPIVQQFADAGGLRLASPASIAVNKPIDGLDTLIPVELYFTNQDGSVNVDSDMREDNIQVGMTYSNPTTSTAACSKTGSLPVPAGPIVSQTVQNPPGLATDSWRVPGYSGTNTKNALVVRGGEGVNVYTEVVDNSGRGLEWVKLYYYIDASGTLDAAPAYTGANYTVIDMALVSGTLWRTPLINPIPAADNSSVWFFIVAKDNDGNFDREPEMEAGAFQYFQQQASVCDNWPNGPTLSGTATAASVELTWTKPTNNTNGTLINDLAGYRVERSINGFAWTPIATIANPDTLTYTDSDVADISTVSYYYQLVAYDSCADWPREGWSNRWRECVGEPTGRIEAWTSDNNGNGIFEPGDIIYPHLTVCGSTQPILFLQDCSATGGDADPIRMKLDPWSGNGDYYIDWDFYSSNWYISTWRQSMYPGNGITPGPATDLDLWLDNSGNDTITLQGYWVPGMGSPPGTIGSTCLAPPMAGVDPLVIYAGVPPATPMINLSTDAWWAWCRQTTNAAPVTFTVTNSGSAPLNYTIDENQLWLSVSPTSGTLAVGASATITVTFASSGLPAGIFTTDITVSDPAALNSPQKLTMNLQVWFDACLNPQPPPAPAGLALAAGQSNNTTAANLVWTQPAGTPAVTSYNLYRCKGAGCNPLTDPARVVRTIAAPATSYVDTTDAKLKLGTYVWTLEAVNSACGTDPKYSYSNVFQEGL